MEFLTSPTFQLQNPSSADDGISERRLAVRRQSDASETRLGASRLVNSRRRMSFHELAVNVRRKVSITAAFKKALPKEEPKKPEILMENTYKMQPDQLFVHHKVKDTIERIINGRLNGMEYDLRRIPRLTCLLSHEVKDAVKNLGLDRHKIICHVVIGQKLGQSIESVSRCLWSNATDNQASYTFENGSMVAIVTVYGVYHE